MAFGIPTFSDEELNYLFGLLKDQTIKAYYDEFTCPRQIISALSAHMPRMRREQPILAEKVETLFKATVDEVLALA